MKLSGAILFLFLSQDLLGQNVYERELPRWFGADKVQEDKGRNYKTPTKKLNTSFYFEDDLDFKDMNLAIKRQLFRYNQISLKGTIKYGKDTYKLKDIKTSLLFFKKLVSKTKTCLIHSGVRSFCLADFNKEINNYFNIYQPDFSRETKKNPQWNKKWTNDLKNNWKLELKERGKFTAYFIPLLEASVKKSKKYPYALYGLPTGEKRSSKRGDIDFNNALGGLGLELYYTTNLFNNYILQVQGSGLVTLEGSDKTFNVAYAGTNKQRWRFISKYMIAEGMISDPSIESQRNYLNAHPEHHKEVFSSCPSYVYLRDNDKIVGNGGAEVTGGRSIATDNDYYLFKGSIAYVNTTVLKKGVKGRPKYSDFRRMSRFMLNQDTGGAINGVSRVDLFLGPGAYPEKASQYQNHPGDLYFLMLKKEAL